MKKINKFVLAIILLLFLNVNSVEASTKTVATATFTAYDMTYYDGASAYWYMGEAAMENTELDEYGCLMNQYGMSSTNAYSAIKSYELQTDCDFSFEGSMSLVFNEGSGVDENTAQIDFFVCTSKGKVIYPNDGSQFKSMTKNEGVVAISGEAKHCLAGDRIYFVALNKSPAKAQYLQFATSVWETEYDKVKEGSFSDTNVYTGIQGDDGWNFMCVKTQEVEFGTVDVEVKEVEDSSNIFSGSQYPEDSGIVVSTAKQLVENATVEDAKKQLFQLKATITSIVVLAAILLIIQTVVFEKWKKKK